MSQSLVFLALAVRSGAIGLEPHTCTLVDITHTNLPPLAADAVRAAYMEAAEVSATEPEPISKRLMRERGGFWDTYFMGSAFSYSVACIEYVELASDAWNVLLCQEAVDEEAYDCGPAGLTVWSNGTLAPPAEDLGATAEGFGVEAVLDMYKNFLVQGDETAERALQAKRAPVVAAAIEERSVVALHQPGVADSIRRDLESRWPHARWNVLVESADGAHGHYYYSEEQFFFVAIMSSQGRRLSVSVFDRRCSTLSTDSEQWARTRDPAERL